MAQPSNKATDVIFYMEQFGETEIFECFAYFPNEKYNNHSKETYWSYAHSGQHAPCHKSYVADLRQATPEEYKDLQKELVEIGYFLNILNK